MPPANDGKDQDPNKIDLNKILLPKKESGPNPQSAQRVNAGALLAQESTAASEGIPATPATPTPTPAPVVPPAAPAPTAPATPAPAAPIAPQPAAAPAAAPVKKPADEVQSLQTFRSDIEKVVHDDSVSKVSIAAAEAERRAKAPLSPEEKPRASFDYKTWAMTAIGVVLILLAAGAVAFVALRPTTVEVPPEPLAPFISVDERMAVAIDTAAWGRPVLLQRLQDARTAVQLPVGLIEWLSVIEPSSDASVPPRVYTIQEILDTLSPQIPPEMLRVLESPYLFGVHSFDENQPLLLLQVDSYETAYAGMLKWERTLQNDLAPLFTRHPVPRIKDSTATTTATTTPQFLSTSFIDKVVENRDTRLIQNEDGDIVLLWTFLGRNIILITTNEYTLREVLSRMKSAPVIPSAGQ